MNKETAFRKYEAATKLREITPISEWKKAFPTVESLAEFRKEVGGFSFPGSYGQSPWDTAFSVAARVTDGSLSESTVGFYTRHVVENESPCPYKLGMLRILESYGLKLPEKLSAAIA